MGACRERANIKSIREIMAMGLLSRLRSPGRRRLIPRLVGLNPAERERCRLGHRTLDGAENPKIAIGDLDLIRGGA